MASNERATAFSNDSTPEKECNKRRRYNDSLEQEEKPKFLDGHQRENGLEDPVDELLGSQIEGRVRLEDTHKGQQASRCDTSTLG